MKQTISISTRKEAKELIMNNRKTKCLYNTGKRTFLLFPSVLWYTDRTDFCRIFVAKEG